MPDQPVLETARLVLRPVTAADGPLLVELDSDPDVVRFITGGEPEMTTDTAAALAQVAAQWPGQGFWIAHDRRTDEFLGWFHLRPGDGHDADEPELGYRLVRRTWGRGLATEGSRALVAYAFTSLGARLVNAETMVINGASRRVMEKVGMRLVRTFHADWPVSIPGDEHGDVEYAITREEWEAARHDER